jgi:hypothetical protein
MLNRDFVGGVAAMVIGAIYLYFATQIRASALDDTVGPGGMPTAYGWIMIALGAIVTAIAVTKTLRTAGGIDLSKEWSGQGVKMIRAAGLLAIGIAYLLIVTTIGYAPAIVLLLGATAFYQGATANFRTAGVALGGAAFLWVVFVALLGVSMPKGVLELF